MPDQQPWAFNKIEYVLPKLNRYRRRILVCISNFENYPDVVSTMQEAETTFIRYIEASSGIRDEQKYRYVHLLNDILRDEMLPCFSTSPEAFPFYVSDLCHQFDEVLKLWHYRKLCEKEKQLFVKFIYNFAPVVLFFIETVLDRYDG